MSKFDTAIDVSGLCCPIPLIRISQFVNTIGPGKTLSIVGDDPVFEQGVRDFCELNHLKIVSVQAQSGRQIEIIIKTAEIN